MRPRTWVKTGCVFIVKVWINEMKNVTLILIMLISTLGPSGVIAAVGYASVRALGRNPSAAPKIFISMILAFVFAEAIAILGLLVVYSLFGA